MDVSLYQAAAAMSATARWQDLVAENLSGASIPGARRQEVSFSDVQAGLASRATSPQQLGLYIPSANPVTNFQPGEMRSTNNPLDFALEGPGFFSVRMPNGQTAYTRDGEFQVNAKGQLVTEQGYTVMGQDGPIQFNPNDSHAITVSPTGEVSQGDQSVGKLQPVEFKDPTKLTKLSTNLFAADQATIKPIPSASTQIRQGFLESANGSPTTEMASMITAMRMFEANEKVLQMQSDRMTRVINDLGGTSSS